MVAGQAEAVRLRSAAAADADMILRWRNDPWIVSLGKGGRSVSASEHSAWMARVLAAPQEHLLLVVQVTSDGQWVDAGLVRLDRVESRRALVTIYLMQPHTGKGYGGEALRMAVDAGFSAWQDLQVLRAEVRPENEASLKVFERCGFAGRPGAEMQPDLVQFELDRDQWRESR